MNVRNKKIKIKFLLVTFLFILYISFFLINCYIHPFGEKECDVLLKHANGQFSKSVNENTRVEKSPVIWFLRFSKGKFTTDASGRILLNDNKVLRNGRSSCLKEWKELFSKRKAVSSYDYDDNKRLRLFILFWISN